MCTNWRKLTRTAKMLTLGIAGKRLFHSQLRTGIQWCSAAPRSGPSAFRLLAYGAMKGPSAGTGWRTLLCLAIPGSLAAYHMLRPSCMTAYCKQKQPVSVQRLILPANTSDKHQPFNWALFFKFVLPDIVLLLVAVSVSNMIILFYLFVK